MGVCVTNHLATTVRPIHRLSYDQSAASHLSWMLVHGAELVMRCRSVYKAALALAFEGCSLFDGGAPELDTKAHAPEPPRIVEDFGTSCEVLCAVPGGIGECPPGTPCPLLTAGEANALFDSNGINVYSGDGAVEACSAER